MRQKRVEGLLEHETALREVPRATCQGKNLKTLRHLLVGRPDMMHEESEQSRSAVYDELQYKETHPHIVKPLVL